MVKQTHTLDQNQKYPRRTVEVETDILLDSSLSLAGRGLYMALLLHRNCSISHLSRILKVRRSTILAHFRELEEAGWATRNQHRLINPVQPQSVQDEKIAWFKQALKLRPYVGESLSFAWLDEWIDSKDYIDHARPSFLKNPVSGQPLEYDRFYPKFKVAFEHQGLQHYGPTVSFPDAAKSKELQLRDWAKKGMSADRGITLVTIDWHDISFEGMKAKIPDALPKRNLSPDDSYIQFLEQESAKYQSSMRKILKPKTTLEEN